MKQTGTGSIVALRTDVVGPQKGACLFKRAMLAAPSLWLICAAPLLGEVPKTITVQGYLVAETGGQPINGPVDFCAALFDAAANGNQAWPPAGCYAINATPVENGLFALVFGEVNPGDPPLPPETFGAVGAGPQPLWLQITAGGQVMMPRIELHSAPYAYRVGFVDNPELTDHVELGSGTPGFPGSLRLFNDEADNTLILSNDTGGGSILSMRNGLSPNQETLRLDANAQGGGAQIDLSNHIPSKTIVLDAKNGSDSVIRVRDPNGLTDMVELSASVADGIVRVRNADGRQGAYIEGIGFIAVFNRLLPDFTPTIGLLGRAEGDGGRLTVTDNVGTPTIYIRGDIGQVECTTIKADNCDILAGCDVAEAFDLSQPDAVRPGMVMVIDTQRPGHLQICSRTYDTKVAGIVSGAGDLRPGMKLGKRADGSNDLPLALSGRVYCLVEAGDHAVAVGDPLTTSHVPGHAMKAVDRDRAFGAVIGKAMEPLAKGKKGLVLVLVALQ